MENNFGKEFENEILGKFNRDFWIQEMKERLERDDLAPFPDVVTNEEYLKAFNQYFGNLDNLKGKKYLDVGVGFGSGLHELMKKIGVEVINADVVPEAIKFLKEKGEVGIIADVFKLPIKDGALDGVISSNLINIGVFKDINDIKEGFKEINRVIKNGGHFIQSHFGYFGNSVFVEDQLKALNSAGFDNVRLIENQTEKELPDLRSLSFIAEKKQI